MIFLPSYIVICWVFILYKPFHKNVTYIQENAERANGERLLGNDPKSGDPVYAKLGKYGPIIQIGDTKDEDKKPRFASLKSDQNIKSIDLDSALSLFEYPKLLGTFEKDEVYLKLGRFGPYIRFGKTFVSIKPKEGDDPMTIDLERSIELIEAKLKADAENNIASFDDGKVKVLNGRFGPYVKIGRKNYKIPKDTDPKSLTHEDCLKLAEEQDAKKKKK